MLGPTVLNARAWPYICIEQGSVSCNQTGVSDILDPQLHHVVGEAIGAFRAGRGILEITGAMTTS